MPKLHLKLSVEKQFEPRTTLSNDHLILLIDPRLAHLPLESLDIFRHVQIGGISRDFSIQSVYNRLNPTLGIEETTAPADGKSIPYRLDTDIDNVYSFLITDGKNKKAAGKEVNISVDSNRTRVI